MTKPAPRRCLRCFGRQLGPSDRHLIANELGKLVDDVTYQFGDTALIVGG